MSVGLLITLFLPEFIYLRSGFGSVRLSFLVGAFFDNVLLGYQKAFSGAMAVYRGQT